MNKHAFASMPAPADCIDTPGDWYPFDDTVHSRAYTAWECSVGEIRVQIAGTQFSDGRVTLEIRGIGDLDGLTVEQTRQLSAALLDAADKAEKMQLG